MRHPETQVGVTALVPRAGVDEGAERCSHDTTSVEPSAWCTVWLTADRSTYSARWTPNGVPLPGGAVRVKPGYDARASSTAALLKARPTASGAGSCTVQRSRVDAPSSVSASARGIGPSTQVTH